MPMALARMKSLLLWEVGSRSFFVATIEEAIHINKILPSNRKIYILNGYDIKYKGVLMN